MSPTHISPACLQAGEAAFQAYEGRDSMYRVASHLLDAYWGRPADMSDALAVLLLTWNQAFYRYAPFKAERVEAYLQDSTNWARIEQFRSRNISTLTTNDHGDITALFEGLLDATATSRGRTPVGVGKAMHLLAPHFFPIWDESIAIEYGCRYSSNPARAYLRFCGLMKEIVRNLQSQVRPDSKSLLKRIDEFNYARYSKGWIHCT